MKFPKADLMFLLTSEAIFARMIRQLKQCIDLIIKLWEIAVMITAFVITTQYYESRKEISGSFRKIG